MADGVIQGIRDWITSGSQKLYKATKRLAYVADVKILIPESWSDVPDTETSTDVAFEVLLRIQVCTLLRGSLSPFDVMTKVGTYCTIYRAANYFILLDHISGHRFKLIFARPLNRTISTANKPHIVISGFAKRDVFDNHHQ